VVGRGKIDGDGVAGKRSAGHGVSGQKFRYRKAREPQQVPRRARAIVFANYFDSHVLSGRTQ
jgi:hypothetical protein